MLKVPISKVISVFILICLVQVNGLFPTVKKVEASPNFELLHNYNRDAAVNWANSNNYNDGSYRGVSEGRYCTTYVTKAMQAGGINVPIYNGNGSLASWLRSHPDYWEIRPKEQLEKGDILFLNNAAQIPDNLYISDIQHVVFITGPSRYSAWNAERENYPFSWFAGAYAYEKGVHFKTQNTVDINGDGKADIVGFGNEGVYVALSNGNGFDQAQFWIGGFANDAGGWRVDKHPRTVADINGDGKADVVGFADDGVYVAISNGTGFGPMQLWSNGFGYNAGGWRVEKHVRTAADVNGDGKADVVGFADDGVFVALSNGSGFGSAELWSNGFGYNAAGWRVEKHVRTVADVNGDGKSDIVGFGDDGVFVSLSTGTSFGPAEFWSNGFAYNAGGWRVEKHPRTVADVNGDGKADIIGFADDGVYIALSTGVGLGAMQLWSSGFGYNTGGWRVEKHPRTAADVNGDGKADVIGFADDGVYVALSTGTGFGAMQLWSNGFGYNAGGWRVDKHVRTSESGYGYVSDFIFVDPAFSKTFPIDSAVNVITSPTLSWEMSKGAVSYQYCIDTVDNNLCDGLWVNTDLQTMVVLDSLKNTTTYYWQVKATNSTGEIIANNSAWWKFTTKAAGEGYGVSINNGSLFTNQVNIVLTLIAPLGTNQMQVSNDGGFLSAQWEPFASIKNWTITQYGNYVIPRIVYVRYKDSSGTISGVYQDDIVLDILPPSGGTSIKSFSSSPVSGSTLTLDIKAMDDSSGVGQMMLSNQSNFSGANWEKYAASRVWILGDNQTVYIRFRDNAGNISSTYSASIGRVYLTYITKR